MVKLASKRPKASKYVPTRPNVQNQVASRIVELKNLGMGFRKISKRLEKEGLATISKSTVANYLDQAQTQNEILARKLRKDPVLNALNKREAELHKQVDYRQTVAQARERVRDLQLRRAETPEGRQDIFKDSEELKKFVGDTLYDSQVLKDFKLHCRANSLPPAKTLSDAVGSLEEYEREKEDLGGELDLPSHIEERMDSFVLDENKRKREENRRGRQEQLQRRFSDIVLNFRCPNCNATSDYTFIVGSKGANLCICGRPFKWLCVECGNALDFDHNKDSWFCRKCGAVFERPRLKLSDFTFIREPADPNRHDSRKDTPRSS